MFFNAETRPVYQSPTFTVSNDRLPLNHRLFECLVILIAASLSAQTRFLNAARPFGVHKLHEINMLICEAINSGNKEIYDCFQYLVEDIFATDKDTNWNLITQHNAQHHDEFNQLYCFLSADGDLFGLIKFLMSDPSCKYLFPVSKLSVGVEC